MNLHTIQSTMLFPNDTNNTVIAIVATKLQNALTWPTELIIEFALRAPRNMPKKNIEEKKPTKKDEEVCCFKTIDKKVFNRPHPLKSKKALIKSKYCVIMEFLLESVCISKYKKQLQSLLNV